MTIPEAGPKPADLNLLERRLQAVARMGHVVMETERTRTYWINHLRDNLPLQVPEGHSFILRGLHKKAIEVGVKDDTGSYPVFIAETWQQAHEKLESSPFFFRDDVGQPWIIGSVIEMDSGDRGVPMVFSADRSLVTVFDPTKTHIRIVPNGNTYNGTDLHI